MWWKSRAQVSKTAWKSLLEPVSWALAPGLARFHRIKRATSGYLKAEVYRELHRAAMSAPAGVCVDIGPGQGASTVVLGTVANSRQDIRRVLSFDPFRASGAMAFGDDVGLNVERLVTNLKRFGVQHKVEIRVVPDFSPAACLQEGDLISVLFIDADGALDRDFLELYKHLAPGASVVVDDFDPGVNSHGWRHLAASNEVLQKYIEGKGDETLKNLNPFGKHHTTWLLVSAMLKYGFLRLEKSVGNTVFLTKPGALAFPYSEELMRREFQLIRQCIYDSFVMVRDLGLEPGQGYSGATRNVM